jgi:DoxX-like family
MATSFAPWLTARTAVGLATIMMLAIGFHVRRHESSASPAIVS